MYYQPPRALGLIVGTVLVLWSAAVAFLLVNTGLSSHGGLLEFGAYGGGVIAIVLTGLFLFWTYSLATLSYALDRNGLVITWGPVRQVIPLQSIDRLVPGGAAGVPRVHGVSWWGHHIGSGEVARLGPVLFYSTHQTADQVLYVMTDDRAYAITMEDPTTFAREVQERQALGPTAEVAHRVERSGHLLQTLLADPRARWLAIASIVGLVLVWLQIALRYDALPETLTLPFPPNTSDAVVNVTGREALLEPPRAATLLLAIDLILGTLVHAWDRMAGYVVLGAGIAVQVGVFIALAMALRS